MAAAVVIDQKLCRVFGTCAVFRSSRSIPAGSPFPRNWWESLADSVVVIAIMGKRWIPNDWAGDFVRMEIAFWLARNR